MKTSESPYTIRNANVKDIDAILALEQDVFPEGTNIGYQGLRRDISEHAPSVKLAVSEDELVGCVRGSLYPSRLTPGRCYGDITSLGISTEHRRQGLGKLLLQEMISEMQSEDPTGIMLHTRVSNMAMQGLATEQGFTIERTSENYYVRTQVPEDAYLMVLHF